MATTPTKGLPLEENRNYPHNLPGHTVDDLLAKGNVDEARDELERLIMEGVDSGPDLPLDGAFYDELRELARRTATGKP